MSKIELVDNLTFLSALEQLKQLLVEGILTESEVAQARRELERKFRPTLLLI